MNTEEVAKLLLEAADAIDDIAGWSDHLYFDLRLKLRNAAEALEEHAEADIRAAALGGSAETTTETHYVLHPGLVFSATDMDQHFVSSARLSKLYGVDPAKCFVHVPGKEYPTGAIHLYPRSNGDYRLPRAGAGDDDDT